jgi:hypothetical protein
MEKFWTLSFPQYPSWVVARSWRQAESASAHVSLTSGTVQAFAFPHRAGGLPRFTPRYARPRGRSHNTSSALTCSPHLEGSASMRPPRRDQRERRATHASDPPHTLATHRVRTRHGSKAGSLSPPHTQNLSSRSG